MINKILDSFKKIDKPIYKIMKNGLTFCFALCIVSATILLIYDITLFSPTLYYIGLSMFKLSCIFGVEFIICGLIVDSISKQMV